LIAHYEQAPSVRLSHRFMRAGEAEGVRSTGTGKIDFLCQER